MSLNSSHTSNNTVSIETNIFQQGRPREAADGVEGETQHPIAVSRVLDLALFNDHLVKVVQVPSDVY